jgi:endoribonuclease Dicer
LADTQALADVVEAILGAAYLSVGFPGVYIATQSFAIPVLEYDATSEIGKKMLPEPPAEVSPLLEPNTLQALEGLIGHKFKRTYYLAHVLVRRSASFIFNTSVFNVVTR